MTKPKTKATAKTTPIKVPPLQPTPPSCLADLLPLYVGYNVSLGISGIRSADNPTPPGQPCASSLHNFGSARIVAVDGEWVTLAFKLEHIAINMAPIQKLWREGEETFMTVRRHAIDALGYGRLTIGR